MYITEKYCDRLISKIYIMLPIYEGKNHLTREVTYSKEEACVNFIKSLNKLKIEISGCINNYPDIVEFIEMYNIIEGLKNITVNQHDVVKQHVFNLIDICEKIKANFEE